MRLEKANVLRVLQDEPTFSAVFLHYLLPVSASHPLWRNLPLLAEIPSAPLTVCVVVLGRVRNEWLRGHGAYSIRAFFWPLRTSSVANSAAA